MPARRGVPAAGCAVDKKTESFCASRRLGLQKTRNKELPALLEERASTLQKRGSEAKGVILEMGVFIKLKKMGPL